MLTKIAGRLRDLFAENYFGPDILTALNNRGDVLTAQSLPDLTELVRLGGSWQLPSTTGQAALTALPTTVAGLTLVNNEVVGLGACYVIDSFGSWEAVVDATQTDVTAIFAMLQRRNSAVPSGGTTEIANIRSLSGRANYVGSATGARDMTVANDGWFAHGTSGQMAAAVAGANWKVNEVQVRGLYIVPPGLSFSVQAVKAAAAAAAQQFFFIRFHTVNLKIVT